MVIRRNGTSRAAIRAVHHLFYLDFRQRHPPRESNGIGVGSHGSGTRVGSPQGQTSSLQRAQCGSSEDKSYSGTTPRLDGHLEEKQRVVGFHFEKEKGARRERQLLQRVGFGKGRVPRCSWGVLPHPSSLPCFWGRNRQAFWEALVTCTFDFKGP